MNNAYKLIYVQILVLFCFINIEFYKVYAEDSQEKENKLIEELHSMYKDAYENEKMYITRRLFDGDGNSHYTLHVQKLKEVNGIKTHNLRVDGRTRTGSQIVYINNPVEAGMPNPYFDIDEFKNIMTERVENQRKEFDVKRQIIMNANKKYKATHKDDHTHQIFDVKKHTELILRKLTEAPKVTTIHTEKNKINRKRKHKENIRNKTNFKPAHLKKTTSFHRITTTKVPDEKITAEINYVDKITTSMIVNKENITKPRAVKNATRALAATKKITTTSIAGHQISTESTTPVYQNLTKSTNAVYQNTTESTTVYQNTTNFTTAYQNTTDSTTAYQNTTEFTNNNQNTTESVTEDQITANTTGNREITDKTTEEEVITEPETTISTTTVSTTKQWRPYVFVAGSEDKIPDK